MSASAKLILGTVQFGLRYGVNNRSGIPDVNQVKNILDLAFSAGIRLLDTAEAYGDAHEVIGHYHCNSPNRFGIITKFSSGRSDLPSGLRERVLQDLSALGVERLYAFMFHSYNDFEAYYARYEHEFNELKREGLIEKFGVSVYTNPELESLLNYPVDLVQLPFNMLDNASQRGSLLAKARKKGMEVHTRSVFLQGLFFMDTLPQKLSALAPTLDYIRKLSDKHAVQLADMALNYVVQQEQIDRVLIGVDTVLQLEQNINSLNRQLSRSLMSELDKVEVQDTILLNPSTWSL